MLLPATATAALSFQRRCASKPAPFRRMRRFGYAQPLLALATSGIAIGTLLAVGQVKAAEPIRLYPDNPHYFLWRGKPAVLITSGEHYGAVLNRDFNYITYLDELARYRFNLTRIFSGTYREVPGSFNIIGNTLAPAAGRFVCPWARSPTTGATDGGNRFDITRWDEMYFARLKDFIRQASQRGVVVELVFFCTMYDDKVWESSPMHIRNNVNGVGQVGKHEVYSAEDPRMLEVQQAVVRKLVTELNAFDNLYYEVCNEPYERSGLTKSWNDRIIATVVETEAVLPKKHLIAQGFPRSSTAVADLNPHVSILNFHAEKPAAVRLNYHNNKVIAFDETGGADRSDRKYRTEGWDWIVAGGGVYDHLDFSFTIDRPDGTAAPLPPGTPGGGGPELRRQLHILKDFIESFDFICMAPHDEIIKTNRIALLASEIPSSPAPTVRALAEIGNAYAIYVNGGAKTELELDLPANSYQAEWINPKSGRIDKTETFSHAGGRRTLASPAYSEDIALRVIRRAANGLSAGATGPLRLRSTNMRYPTDRTRSGNMQATGGRQQLKAPFTGNEALHVVKEATGKAVQIAIDACAAQGGGVVCLPPGRYVSGPLWLKDNIELRLEADATVVLSHDKTDWPAGVRALVNAKGAKHIAVTGRGAFDGDARWEYAPVRRPDPEIAEEQANAQRAGIEMKRYYRAGEVQKYLFVLQDTEDVRLEGVTIRNAPLWNVRLQDCNRVWIRGIFLHSDLERGVNSDGIDIVSSANVLISDSIIATADDAICLKTVDLGGRGAGTIRPTENVLVNNCILTSSSTPMMIGTETHADIHHVLFSNIIVRNSNKVFGINVQDGATVSDVRFVNVTFETNRRHWNWWGSAEVMKFVLKKRTPQSRLGRIRYITIDGAQGAARGTSLVAGHAERKLENITIANLSVKMLAEDRPDKRATDALVFQDIDGLTLGDVEVIWDREKPEPKWGSALVLRNISNLVLQNFQGQAARPDGPLPAVVEENVNRQHSP
jgi:hypothetical protein